MIFHAAAYKHVPLMESENAWQAVHNNVHGTHVVADAAAQRRRRKVRADLHRQGGQSDERHGRDQARSPRWSARRCSRPQGTRFVMVRFGNVLGSTGSVIPKFREQIARRRPGDGHASRDHALLHVDPRGGAARAAGGAAWGTGGEIFVLDMGEPVRIADLARDLIRLSGFSEDEIKIVYTGLRPGEKLYEELLGADEDTLPTPHAKLRIARARQENGPWLARAAAPG